MTDIWPAGSQTWSQARLSPVLLLIRSDYAPNWKDSMNILHYGLQRSGTNYLETLLKKNYWVRFLNSNQDRRSPLQKHCRLYKNKQIIPEPQYRNDIVVETFEQFESLFAIVPHYYLIVSKDPYSWYLSYRNWAKKCKWPDVTHHYIEEYNLFYGTFLKFSSQSNKFVFVRYVDLIKDAGEVMNHLQIRMKLKKRLLAHLALRVPGKVSQSDAFTDETRAYYLNGKYLEEYSAKDIKILNDLLDPQVTSLLGYERNEGQNEGQVYV